MSALAAAVLLALPLITSRFPPITDLPQQAAQVRLLSHALSDGSEYRLNLGAPGWLGYGLFGLSWLVVGAEDAGRTAYLVLGLFWLGSFAVIGRSYRLDPATIALAALFFFSHPLYWGFFSFLFGACLFLLWTVVERSLEDRVPLLLEVSILAFGLLVLYSSHLFWFLAAVLWTVATTLLSSTRRHRLPRLASLLPAVALAARWLPRLTESGFASETAWDPPPWGRLAPDQWVDRVFGGLRGPVEPAVLTAVLVWLAIGLWQHRVKLRHSVDPTLLLLGCLMLAGSLVLPDRYQNTLRFASRWAPVGVALIAVAVPPPKIRAWLRWLVPVALLATLTVTTTAVWKRFEELELAGLEESFAALPAESSLLGLDFYRLSQLVKTQPFFQIHAYGQVSKGGNLGFSFASFPASPVVFREWENPPWTAGLEWLPHEIFEQMDDVLFFDYVLIHVDPAGHAFFAQQPQLEPVTDEARWRLYRVVDPPSEARGPAPSRTHQRGNE